MKIPRDITGAELAKALRRVGYQVTRQAGSHLMVTTIQGGQHHVTVPNHRPIKVGTLQGILKSVADHHGLSLGELLALLEL